jgi:hypothetical protein
VIPRLHLRDLASLVALGIVGTLPWTVGFGWLFHRLYVLAVSPAQPSLWLICSLSVALGILPGAAVPLLSTRNVIRAWLVFFLAFVACLITVAVFAGDITLSLGHIGSAGFWSFVLGTLLGAFSVSAYRRRPLTARWSRP